MRRTVSLLRCFSVSHHHPYDNKVTSSKVSNGFYSIHANKRVLLDKFAEHIGIKTQPEWYLVSSSKISSIATSTLFKNGVRLHTLLANVYPEYDWYPWMFETIPKYLWDEPQTRRKFLDWIAYELLHSKHEDLMHLSASQYHEHGGKGLLALYNESVINMLEDVYPERTWHPWTREEPIPNGYWKDQKHHRLYLDWLAQQLGVKHLDEWYTVDWRLRNKPGFGGLLARYGGSFLKALETNYPEHTFLPWKFAHVPPGFWTWRNQRRYFDWLADEHGIEDQKGWYKLSLEDLKKGDARGMLQEYYNGSFIKALEGVYLEYTWIPWLFQQVPVNFWADLGNQKKFLDWVAGELGITSREQWYQTSSLDIIDKGGHRLLHYYDGSFIKALETIYPGEKFYPWLFPKTPAGFWENDKNILEYLEWLRGKLGFVNKLEDWENVTSSQVAKFGGTTLLHKYGGLTNVLAKVYPQHKWKVHNPNTVGYTKSQMQLFLVAKKLFPTVPHIHFNYKHPQMFFSSTHQNMELDVFIPSLSLALEYHGNHHYHYRKHFGDPTPYMAQDLEKQEACKANGITLIVVPYWWDYTEDSIIATIHQHRPDIIPHPGKGQPIPTTPPSKFSLSKFTQQI